MADAEAAKDRESLLAFTDKWLKSYQIPFEIFGLIDSLNQLQPKNFMEIGMCDGGTHFLIRKLCPSICESVAVDPESAKKLAKYSPPPVVWMCCLLMATTPMLGLKQITCFIRTWSGPAAISYFMISLRTGGNALAGQPINILAAFHNYLLS
jgi:hypothetical protein